MKKSNRIQAIVAGLSLVLLGVVVSCTRNLSVPVTAVIATSTFTYTPTANVTSTYTSTGTSTTTATVTNTITLAQTGTNTSTPTATGTPPNTSTATVTNTVTYTSTPAPPTNTQTTTSTETTTNTPPPTNTQTSTMTYTATVAVTNTPSQTPPPSWFDDFDETTSTSTGGPWWVSGTSAISPTNCTTGLDTNAADAYLGSPNCTNSGMNTAAQSAAMTISGAVNGGNYSIEIEAQVPNCTTGIYQWSPVPDTGTYYTLSMMLNAQAAGMTVTGIHIITSGNAYLTSCQTFTVPVGSWGNLVAPFSTFSSTAPCITPYGTNQGTNAGLLAGTDAIESIYVTVQMGAGGNGSMNIDNIVLY